MSIEFVRIRKYSYEGIPVLKMPATTQLTMQKKTLLLQQTTRRRL